MIQSKFADDIQIEPRFSKRLACVLIILHISVALTLLIPTSLNNVIKISILIILIINLLHNIRTHLLLINCTLCGAILHYDSLWLKTQEKAEIVSSYAHPLLIILRAKTKAGKTHNLILFQDSVDKTTFRRVRVRLRHVLSEEK